MSEAKPRLSVIIPAWNEVDALPKCLASVFASSFQNLEVIVVDNGSTDGTADLIAREFPRVRLLRNPENLGFGRALNQGSDEAVGEVLLWLNADTTLDRAWIESMVATLDEHPQAGMMTSVVTYEDTPNLVWSAGGWVDGLTGLSWDHGKGQEQPAVTPATDPDYAAACALFVRRDVLERSGGLDAGYFIYFEDADLGLRLKGIGYATRIVGETPIRHGALRRTGLRGTSGAKLFLFSKSNLRFILKNWSLARLPVATLSWSVFYGAVALSKGVAAYLPAVVRAAVWNLQHLEETKAMRRGSPPLQLPPPRVGGLARFLLRMVQHPELFPY